MLQVTSLHGNRQHSREKYDEISQFVNVAHIDFDFRNNWELPQCFSHSFLILLSISASHFHLFHVLFRNHLKNDPSLPLEITERIRYYHNDTLSNDSNRHLFYYSSLNFLQYETEPKSIKNC